ncbi:MAG: hypothetical protein HDQ88_10645 [Clostridia bacterium]|nr:hypothetical protein [Clostridia bacterium]
MIISFGVLFFIAFIMRISFGVYVDEVAWFASALTPLTIICVVFFAILIARAVAEIIRVIRK